MPSWANQLGQQFPDDMIDPGNPPHQLQVLGQTTLNGGLQVGAAGNLMTLNSDANSSRIEAPLNDGILMLNADAPLETGDVIISHPDNPGVSEPNVLVRSPRLRIGSENQAGNIDADGQDVPLMGQTLNIGTQQRTRNVVIGRTDAADPNANVKVDSQLLLGNQPGQGGRIDAELDGAAARNLEVGGQNSTADVNLGRAGQTVRLSAPLNANGNAVSLDAAGILQVVSNAAGHGWGASADFVVAGNVVGWFDAAGIHVQPPAPPAP